MTPPYAGTHTESRFAREIQQESSNNVALHFRASAPSAPTKSIAYVTRPRTKCRRWAMGYCGGTKGSELDRWVPLHVRQVPPAQCPPPGQPRGVAPGRGQAPEGAHQ